jgi:hypothetical protein
MWKDPVVEEVRAIRDEYARQFNYDIEAICRDLRDQENQSDREVVTLPPKRIILVHDLPGSEEKVA